MEPTEKVTVRMFSIVSLLSRGESLGKNRNCTDFGLGNEIWAIATQVLKG